MFTYTGRNGKQKQINADPGDLIQAHVSFHTPWSKMHYRFGPEFKMHVLNELRESDEWKEALFEYMRVQYNPSFCTTDERLEVMRKCLKMKPRNRRK